MLLALTFFLTRKHWVEVAEIGGDSKPQVAAARTRDTLRRPVVWLGMLTFFLYTGVELVAAQWSYSLLTLGRDVSATTAGLLVSFYWGSLMVGRILFGVIANRVPLVRTLRICLIASTAGALLFWLEPTRLLSFLGLMLIGFALAPVFASLISLTPRRVGAEHADSAIGFQIASAGLGGAVFTALVGVLARPVGLNIIGVAIVAFSVILLVLYELFMRPGRQGSPQSPTA